MARNNRKQHTVLSGAFLGACVTVLCYAVGTAVIAYCTLNELLGQQGSGIGVLMTIVLSVTVGEWIAASTVSEKNMLTSVLSGAILMLVALSGALLLDGPFVNALPTAGAISVGTIVVCVLCMKRQKKQPHRKSAYR